MMSAVPLAAILFLTLPVAVPLVVLIALL